MSLIQYEPVNFLTQMQRDLNDFFKLNGNRRAPALFEPLSASFIGEWLPTADIKENDKQYTINVDVPGVDPKDIEVFMEDGCLVVKGERQEEKEEKDESHYLKENSYGLFERRFRMPESADAKHIKAKNKNGVLNITIAKSKEKAQRSNKIPISS